MDGPVPLQLIVLLPLESLLKASLVTRTRHLHQMTAAALYVLLHQVCTNNPSKILNQSSSLTTGSQKWQVPCHNSRSRRWYRTWNWLLIVHCLLQLLPWFFALVHVNARWLSVHVRNLTMLERHTSTFSRILGGFDARETKRVFSAIAFNKSHDQCSALAKGEREIVGLTNNSSALRCWMVTGPEVLRIVEEFGKQAFKGEPNDTAAQFPSYFFSLK
ncbi:hypothetical protein PoB_005071900 [Plakobranchus ocellatus]|uniref:Uncharacterized protein n=1 Tax=Plakobranchus ocellatus TaxID=259542 RepID=A0AAV4BVI5_9GAST|nr:hypothetical protein PoB_005071900 [Plakobranchus ocellatus]